MEQLSLKAKSYLNTGQHDKALKCLKRALREAKNEGFEESVRDCLFTLGSALIAVGKHAEGLQVLNRIQCDVPDDSMFYADVWYNKALAYEWCEDYDEAVTCLQSILEGYRQQLDNSEFKAMIWCKMAAIYTHTDCNKAAEAYGIAAAEYQLLRDVEKQAVCLCQQAVVLRSVNKDREMSAAVQQCLAVCNGVTTANKSIGRVLNELGLMFSQRRTFDDALTCFKKALTTQDDKSLKSVLLQNCGAIYNCLEDYQQAIKYSLDAASLCGEVNDRAGQAQCYCCAAFAFSQRDDLVNTYDYYRLALQAARDTDDNSTECKALEGLASVAFRKSDYKLCQKHLQDALPVAANIAAGNTGNTGNYSRVSVANSQSTAQQRIINKLTHVIQLQQQNSMPHRVNSMVQNVNSMPPQPCVRSSVSANKQQQQHRPVARPSTAAAAAAAAGGVGVGGGGPGGHGESATVADNVSDTMRERQQQQEAYRQLQQANKQPAGRAQSVGGGTAVNGRAVGGGRAVDRRAAVESTTDEDDDDYDSDESTETDSQQEMVETPKNTAPHAPQQTTAPNNTYLLAATGNKKPVKYSEPSELDPTYMTIRTQKQDEAGTTPPVLPSRNSDAAAAAGAGDDEPKLPVRPKSQASVAATQDSHACHIM